MWTRKRLGESSARRGRFKIISDIHRSGTALFPGIPRGFPAARRMEYMQIKTDGIIIKEQTIGESDRLVTILTRDAGVIRAFARRAKSLKDSKNSATGLLAYSRLSIFRGRDKYIVDSASPIEVFFGLRRDIGRLSLAQYFCELAASLVPEETDSAEYLRLVLNSLHFLANGTKGESLLKAITELRMLSISGYMPDLIACKNCGAYESGSMYFLPLSAMLLCENCYEKGDAPAVHIPMSVLTAMRHICYSEFEKLYSFSLSDKAAKLLAYTVENYTVHILGRMPGTLEFYKSVAGE